MMRFLIVRAEYRCGRGARGLNLQRFLSIYHGHRAVRMISADDLLRGPSLATDVLFIGMPTSLTRNHLAKVRFRQAVLFDYHDTPRPAWLNSDRDLLLSVTDQYFKTWVEPGSNGGLRLGVLPIRRHAKLTLCVQFQNIWERLFGDHERRRLYDVVFLGNATAVDNSHHERINWLREIQQANGRFSFWGGIAARPDMRERLRREYGDLAGILYPKARADFVTYYHRLGRSRVALAPGGNAPWTYRHYEAIYAGAVLVSTDFRHIRTLIPLPLDRMVHVAGRASVLPAIEQALRMREADPGIAAENVLFLERYLHRGDYSKGKPELMDRFLAQL